jgi:hypothetical protein
MPATSSHPVTLDYTIVAGHPRVVQPPAIRVGLGDTIHFLRGAIPPGFKATIIFDEPQFFSAPTFDEGDPEIRVVAKLPHRTTYRCGLKDGSQLVPGSVSGPADGGGGDIDPVGEGGS